MSLSATLWSSLGPRSLLFVPADRLDELLFKALASKADGVILDLEDAVLPVAKSTARDACVRTLARPPDGVPIFVRVNPLASMWGNADLARLADTRVAGFVIPKVDDVSQIEAVARLVPNNDCGLIALIETAAGVLGAAAIAAHPRVIGLALGVEDLGAHLGLRRSRHGHELLFARSQVILAAAAAARWALDSPCVEPRGIEATRREALRARGFGYTGKLLIHPAQVTPTHEAFAPAPDEVSEARRLLAEYEQIAQDGRGVGTLDGQMIDRPMLLLAEQVLARANMDRKAGDESS